MDKRLWSRRRVCIGISAATTVCLLPGSGSRAQAKPGFAEWLAAMRIEAEREGVSKTTLDRALPLVQPIASVLALDSQQPESTMTIARYLAAVVTAKRLADAKQQKRKYAALLVDIAKRYGVPADIVVALWSAETYFGRNQGRTPVLSATATLAHAGRRPTLFKAQFIAALKILDAGDIAADKLLGSWAGAMGQVQFLPTSYLNYAVDYDANGKRDIWQSVPDALASAANYLVGHGWTTGQPWGFRATLGKQFQRDADLTTADRTLAEWRARGIAVANAAPHGPAKLRFLEPDGAGQGAYLVLPNYEVILKWNRSNHFALSIGLLADRIGS
ncbi:MAG: lytic transglycosylase domain-containing protein [Alphaproteobacteria bacterium]